MTTFVLASGPSLTPEDIETASQFRTIAVNSTIFSAPFADVCFAMDNRWWEQYHKRVKELPCRRVSTNAGAKTYGCEVVKNAAQVFGVKINGSNSGLEAIAHAYQEGEREIVLLGFDCQHKDGKAHHHPDHPAPMKNANRTNNWPAAFQKLANVIDARVINCTRETALTCFERMTLEEYLGY